METLSPCEDGNYNLPHVFDNANRMYKFFTGVSPFELSHLDGQDLKDGINILHHFDCQKNAQDMFDVNQTRIMAFFQ